MNKLGMLTSNIKGLRIVAGMDSVRFTIYPQNQVPQKKPSVAPSPSENGNEGDGGGGGKGNYRYPYPLPSSNRFGGRNKYVRTQFKSGEMRKNEENKGINNGFGYGYVYPVNPSNNIRAVMQAFVYPGYRKSKSNNDIALLRLDRPLPLFPYASINTVCLPAPGELVPETDAATTAGWGQIKEGGSQAFYLKAVNVSVVNDR